MNISFLTIFSLLGIHCFLFCYNVNSNPLAQSITNVPGHFTINGKIGGLKTGKIYLISRNLQNSRVIDSSLVQKGRFTFSGELNGYSNLFYLKLDSRQVRNADSLNSVQISIEDSKIYIRLKLFEFSKYKIKGCKTCDEQKAFKLNLENPDSIYSVIYKKSLINLTDSANEVLYEELLQRNFTKTIEYIKTRPDSKLSPFLLKKNTNNFSEKEIDRLVNIFNSLSFQGQNSFSGEQIKIVLAEVREKRSLIGEEVPDLKAITRTGEIFDLKSFVKEKLTLLDFWASWCAPCRKGNPELRSLFNRYHQKGLNIVAISDDTDREKWLNAIETDSLDNFTHLLFENCQTSRWKSVNGTSNLFFNSLPTRILVNSDGKIVGRFFSDDVKQIENLVKKSLGNN